VTDSLLRKKESKVQRNGTNKTNSEPLQKI